MSDSLIQVQEEIVARLDYAEALQFVPIRSLRKALVSSSADIRIIYQLGKNGRTGVGVVVGMPSIEGVDINVSTPQSEIVMAIDVLECPELNMASSGTQLSAEEVARAVRAHLHTWRIEGVVTLVQDKQAVFPLEGIEERYPSCLGYRVQMRGRLAETAIKRLSLPSISAPATIVTLVASADGVQIVYTVDGSGPIPSNAQALTYTTPFSVADGTLVRWAAYAPGWQGSDYGWAIIHAT